MENKQEQPAPAETPKPIALPKGLDVIAGILNPPKPVKAAEFKQQTTPRNKQQRGGNRK